MAEEEKKTYAPSDYAALLRTVRETENMRLEIHSLQNQLKTAQARLMSLEAQVKTLELQLEERDSKIEEMMEQVGDKSKGLLSKMRQKDETINRLQTALQNKHRELEEVRAKGGLFKR